MRYLLVLSILLIGYTSSSGQINQKIGEWRSYLPYSEGRWVTQSQDKIYYSTEQSLFSIQKEDVTDIMFQSKVEGLSDVGIKRVAYDNFNEQLIVVYDNSNIDLRF